MYEVIMAVLTLIAILIGPPIGVWLGHRLQENHEKRQRKLDVFRNLMRTRNLGLSYDHVTALNLIEVEFIDDNEVLEAWKNYLQELSKPPLVGTPTPEAINQRDEDRRKLLTKLLHRISKSVSYDIDQMDVYEKNYIPQGWLDDEQQQKLVRVLMLNLLSGRSTLPIAVRGDNTNDEIYNPFPPRPE